MIAKTYEEFIEPYQKLLTYARTALYKRYLYNQNHNKRKEDVDQLIQIAAWQAYEKIREGGTYTFQSYFFNGIKFLTGKRGLCSDNYNLVSSIPANFDKTEQVDDTIDIKELIEIGLGSLTDLQKQVIKFRYYEGMTLQQSGDALGYSSEYIRLIQNKALETMKRELSELI